MSLAYCCEICEDSGPRWVITRHGDAVITWACNAHLAVVCMKLQREHEVTQLSLRDYWKVCETAVDT